MLLRGFKYLMFYNNNNTNTIGNCLKKIKQTSFAPLFNYKNILGGQTLQIFIIKMKIHNEKGKKIKRLCETMSDGPLSNKSSSIIPQ